MSSPQLWARLWARLALACAGLLLAGPARAQDFGTNAAAGTAVYSNNDGLRVISPWLQARQRLMGPASVQAHARTDFISAASVDMLSGASSYFDEVRKEAGVRALWDDAGTGGHAGYTYSTENDTHSHTLVLGAKREWLARNLTTALAYGLGKDRLGSVREPEELWHDRSSHRVDLSVSQLLSRTGVAAGAYTLEQVSGFQSSPYRMVPLVPRDPALWSQQNAMWVAEHVPDERVRHGLTLQWRQALAGQVFVRTEWRGYLDTWSVRSHTGEVAAGWQILPSLELELTERIYWQSRASFARTMYSVDREYITRDRRLIAQVSNSTGLHARVRWRKLEVLLQGILSWTRYDDFRTLVDGRFVPMPDTWALVTQAALGLDL